MQTYARRIKSLRMAAGIAADRILDSTRAGRRAYRLISGQTRHALAERVPLCDRRQSWMGWLGVRLYYICGGWDYR